VEGGGWWILNKSKNRQTVGIGSIVYPCSLKLWMITKHNVLNKKIIPLIGP
jgi:hypothetical protein